MWIYQKDPRQGWITQALCPRCGSANAANTDLRVEDEKRRFEKKHRFCFVCGKDVTGVGDKQYE